MKKEYIKPQATLVLVKDDIMFNGASQSNPGIGISAAKEMKAYDDFGEYERPLRYERYKAFSEYDEYIEYNNSLWDDI